MEKKFKTLRWLRVKQIFVEHSGLASATVDTFKAEPNTRFICLKG